MKRMLLAQIAEKNDVESESGYSGLCTAPRNERILLRVANSLAAERRSICGFRRERRCVAVRTKGLFRRDWGCSGGLLAREALAGQVAQHPSANRLVHGYTLQCITGQGETGKDRLFILKGSNQGVF